MVNETPQWVHAFRKGKSSLQARRFRVTYFEGPVKEEEPVEREREKGFIDGQDQGGIKKREAEKEGSGQMLQGDDTTNEER